jgi:hypothetical protein
MAVCLSVCSVSLAHSYRYRLVDEAMEAALPEAAKQTLRGMPEAVNGTPIKPLLRMYTRHLPVDPVEAVAEVAGGKVRHRRRRAGWTLEGRPGRGRAFHSHSRVCLGT